MTIEEIKQKISPVLGQYSVSYGGVFGSFARGDNRADSDVDLLVRFKEMPGLFRYIRLENELSEILGRRVDLATEQSLHRIIKKTALADLKTIYEG